MIDPVDDAENPTPCQPSSAAAAQLSTQHWELLAQQHSEEDAALAQLTGSSDLEAASCLQVLVDTSKSSVSHLGAKLPNLKELNLNHSFIDTLRDLGTGFTRLEILWVSRCSLHGLDGVGLLPNLKELYAAFNDVPDLEPLRGCLELEVLDLEGNCVCDFETLDCLQDCANLCCLTLAANPLADHPSYRSKVAGVLPLLATLDDQALDKGANSVHTEHHTSTTGATQQSAAETGAEHSEQSEMQFVCEGIKHARVGVDSQEFKEVEMSLLMASQLPPGCRPTTGGVRPGTASSWMQAMRQSQPIFGGLGGGISQSPPSTSSSRAASDRPFSGPPCTARVATASSSGRSVTTGDLAKLAASNLYWRKHSIAQPHAPNVKEEPDDVLTQDPGSDLTVGVRSGFGASLAKDLRNWKKTKQAAAAGVEPAAGQHATALPASLANNTNTSLLDRLRDWKVKTADVALIAEDESASWRPSSAPTPHTPRSGDAPEGSLQEAADILKVDDAPGDNVDGLSIDVSSPKLTLANPLFQPNTNGGANRKHMLAKVLRDAANLIASQQFSVPSPQGELNEVRPPPNGVRVPEGRPLSRAGSARREGYYVAGEVAELGDEAIVVRSRPSSREMHEPYVFSMPISATQSPRTPHSAGEKGVTPFSREGYHIVSVVGEIDLQEMNPAPAVRPDE